MLNAVRSMILIPIVLIPSCAATDPMRKPVGMDAPVEEQLQSMVWILTGSWAGLNEERPGENRLWEAHYTSPAGGVMIGTTKRYDDNIVDFYKFETFQVENGKVTVKPFLNGSPPVAYTLKSLDPEKRRAVFERPDYEPQNIEFWRMDDETLAISVTSPNTDPARTPEQPAFKGMRIGLRRLQ